MASRRPSSSGIATSGALPVAVLVAVVMATMLTGTSTQIARAVTPSGVIPTSIVDRYLTVRPTLGDVTVVSIVGEPEQRQLLAATLQGVVNRTSARIYLVGAGTQGEDQRWLDHYVSAGLVHVSAHLDLDQALSTFKSEISGFVVASYSEPWTINTATSVAAERHALVATPDEVVALQGLGLAQIDDHVGRWPDAPTAYEAIATQVQNQLPYQGLAIVKPDQNALRDFLVQQGIMAISTRPSDPDYDRIMHLLDPYPAGRPVYGYVSDDDAEEVQAIIRHSIQGRFVVPTDTTDNLSIHIAVAATTPRVVLQPDERPVAACKSSQVNVVIATSDGDNMVIPQTYLPSADRWGSAARGKLPMGWGISPAAAVLMPAIWDSYASTTTAQDEIVGLLGMGYSAPSLMPDPKSFLEDSNRLEGLLGIDTTWSLDLLLGLPNAKGWDAISAANTATGWHPKGQLLNYDDYDQPRFFFGAGLPVLTSQATTYLATPESIADSVAALQAMPDDERPLVNFFPATVWSTTYDRFVAAFQPLVNQGVRVLTPRQAWACIAAAGIHAPTTTTTSTTTSTSTSTSTSTTTSTTTTTVASTLGSTAPSDSMPASATTSSSLVDPERRAATPVASTPAYVG